MLRPRTWIAALALYVLLAGCGSEETQTSSSPEETPAARSTPTASAEPASPLEGTWRTGPISRRDSETTLRRHGLGKWIERFRAYTPFKATITLTLDIHDGEWDLSGKPRVGPSEDIDYDAEYVVEGDRVEKIHATGSTFLRWTVDGDVLTLEWLRTNEAPYEGIPDEVFQRALYMTEPFERQG